MRGSHRYELARTHYMWMGVGSLGNNERDEEKTEGFLGVSMVSHET